ncbi:hypothetical protein [Streptomyces sp. NPDC048669]|uniref:hypothetical protein n=1 Tax=Streptomyces sp. NPDC048669 TaxID=3155267 RepID=UPI003412A565
MAVLREVAVVLEDFTANGLPPVEERTPREELREKHLTRLAAQPNRNGEVNKALPAGQLPRIDLSTAT